LGVSVLLTLPNKWNFGFCQYPSVISHLRTQESKDTFALWMRLDPVSLLQQDEHLHLCLPLPAASGTAFPPLDPRMQCEPLKAEKQRYIRAIK